MSRLLIASGFVALAAGACARHDDPQPAAEWTLRVEPLASPAGPASAQPQLTASDRGMVLSWLENVGGTTTLKFSERTSDSWSEPRQAAAGRNLFSNWADVPSVVRLSTGTLVAHWLQETDPAAEAYDLRMATSNDDGRSWSPPFSPHHDGTRSEHGFASLFEMPGTGLGVVWLDGRSMKEPPSPAARSAGVGEPSVGLRAASFDREWTQLFEDAVDTRVCECCPTAAAVTSAGPIVAFRDRSNDETRDIYISRFVDQTWTEPAAVHNDGWQINGCPVNGPALSASGRDVAVAWFTAPNEDGHAFVAFSRDAGQTFGLPVRVDDVASLGRVDVELLPDGSAVVAWIEFADQRATLMLRRIDRSGRRSIAATVTAIGANRSSFYPRMARRGNELVFAWASAETLQVETAIARIP